jgi:2-oxoglutarate ferredoxin oxidoreductase subunit delta
MAAMKAAMPKKQKGKIVIDRALCKGCKYCIMSCPSHAITLDEKFNDAGFFTAVFSHPEKCTGCAICANMCPEIAIEVWRQSSDEKA